MSLLIYTGKFNYAPFASNENIFVVFLNGWVERGRVLVFSTFTRDAAGVEKRPFDLDTNGTATQYLLQAQDGGVKNFIIRDLDQAAYYHFTGVRNNDNSISLTMRQQTSTANLTTIQLAKLK